ncbi:ribosomal-processing cysteine protease Prp [Cuneatibacter caecimuris]|uniref:Ribosomal processing cysteine protease Prp n=1 Tax=Cuneatibacter caecimuris TaxID=1796618 RepID=A0A4Q7NZS5_9FIRM|nr:ribosomal-processing cysteine protease Prp [Cuneatibacter caecimuris]RZS93003.1 hypothetical protein EV209_2749 [Cuneatibacter caecimuris]
MIRVTIMQDSLGEPVGFVTEGHAEYAEAGRDIICAAVSVLVLNAVNSVEQFTEDGFQAEQEQESGKIRFHFTEEPSVSGRLLIRSMILGLEQIQEEYGTDYLRLQFEEV